jgi:mannose-6-phosphate isomerase-like protein (cupin superfamily)
MKLLTRHMVEMRPWGSFERFTENEVSTVKIISLAPGQRFSLQTHTHRAEFWKILSGTGTVLVSDKECAVRGGDWFEIPVGTKHRASAGTEGLVFLEISLGTSDENDITRLEDDFGRT